MIETMRALISLEPSLLRQRCSRRTIGEHIHLLPVSVGAPVNDCFAIT
jgi:hypothetical protein